MRVDDLFEADIIQFPGRKTVQKEPPVRHYDINPDVMSALKDQVKSSITKQKNLALPTIMRDQPRQIKPVVAWAIALDEVSRIQNKDKIQQWIYDTGKTIIDDLLKFVRDDITAYKELYNIKMEPWETGKTSAMIFKYKQVDRNAEDMLEDFKRNHVDKAA